MVADRGEIRVASDVWDYTFEGSTMCIRAGLGNILFELEFKNGDIILKRGRMIVAVMQPWLYGDVEISPSNIPVTSSAGTCKWSIHGHHAFATKVGLQVADGDEDDHAFGF